MMHQKNVKLYWSDTGFTLVELLVAVAISGIVGVGIMSLYVNSSKTYESQTLVAEAQQNVRAGLDALVWDLRMAGYDPARIANTGIVSLDPDGNGIMDSIHFTADLNEDGNLIDADDSDGDGDTTEPDPNEDIVYSLYDSGSDDVYGNAISRLGRDTGGGNDPVAEYIQALGFAYAFDSNDDGELDADIGGRTHWAVIGANNNWWELDADNDDQITAADDTDNDNDINSIDTGIPAVLEDIRAVKIWLLASGSRQDRNAASEHAYVVGSAIVRPGNDSIRRRLLKTSVYCRNMGL